MHGWMHGWMDGSMEAPNSVKAFCWFTITPYPPGNIAGMFRPWWFPGAENPSCVLRASMPTLRPRSSKAERQAKARSEALESDRMVKTHTTCVFLRGKMIVICLFHLQNLKFPDEYEVCFKKMHVSPEVVLIKTKSSCPSLGIFFGTFHNGHSQGQTPLSLWRRLHSPSYIKNNKPWNQKSINQGFWGILPFGFCSQVTWRQALKLTPSGRSSRSIVGWGKLEVMLGNTTCWGGISTQLKDISQIGSFPQVGVKVKNLWNHHLVIWFDG